jgi:hypothetical protein
VDKKIIALMERIISLYSGSSCPRIQAFDVSAMFLREQMKYVRSYLFDDQAAHRVYDKNNRLLFRASICVKIWGGKTIRFQYQAPVCSCFWHTLNQIRDLLQSLRYS